MFAPLPEKLDAAIDQIAAEIVNFCHPNAPIQSAAALSGLSAAGSFLLAYRADIRRTEDEADAAERAKNGGAK